MNTKHKTKWAATLFAAVLLSGCSRTDDAGNSQRSAELTVSENHTEEIKMQLIINGEPAEVVWQDNEAVRKLEQLARNGLTITTHPYGGFEQVGPIGAELPSQDSQITSVPGDIFLYQGNQIVLFYGSNTWDYTRLGHLASDDADTLHTLLDQPDGLTLTLQ